MNLKTITVSAALAAVVSAPALADEPITFSGVSCRQDMGSRDLIVNYTLNGQPAIVRLDVLTNGTSIGRGNIKTFHASTDGYSATLTSPIATGARTIRWRARQDWPSNLVENLNVKLCALYPAEVSSISPAFYDDYAPRQVYTLTSGAGWTYSTAGCTYDSSKFTSIYYLPDSGIEFYGNDISPDRMTSDNTATSPEFAALDLWRVSFDVKVTLWEYSDTWDTRPYVKFSIRGLDAEDNELFSCVATPKERASKTSFMCNGIELPYAAWKTLVLVRDSYNTFTVYGKDSAGNYQKGTAPVTITNPAGKLSKLRIYFLHKMTEGSLGNSSTWGKAKGNGNFKNIKVDDISASPF